MNLFEQSHPSQPTDNLTSAALTWENMKCAIERMREFLTEEYKPQPTIRIVPPEIRLTETKYWIPFGNEVVLVNEEVEYKFIHRLQGYLRDKRQNVDMARFIKV